MIYICTVHYQTDAWIRPQLDFLQKNLNRPHRIFACVPEDYEGGGFDRAETFEPESEGKYNHADKLNYLARLVLAEGKPSDILIFLDGDAFPVREIGAYVEEGLSRHKLMAVQRLENLGDMQPHPSFAATTVGFWAALGGDWRPGYRWDNSEGVSVTDTGGNLLRQLNDASLSWYPMLRTNRRNLHPLWFGIYDDVVYHHGAGYREALSRLDLQQTGLKAAEFKSSSHYRNMETLRDDIFASLSRDVNFHERFFT